MKSSGNYSIEGSVYIDEFVIGGKEEGKIGRSYDSKKKKIVCTVELTEEGKVKRMYNMKIVNYSTKEVKKLIYEHVSTEATATTDKRKGYRPLIKPNRKQPLTEYQSLAYHDTSSKIMY